MDLSTHLQQTFAELEKNVPGFISVSLIKTDDGTVIVGHTKESKQELALISPFHLQIYKQAIKSLDISDNSDSVEEIMISTKKRLYVIASRSPKAIGVMTLDISKANLGITRIFVNRVAQEVYEILANAGVL